MKLSDKHIEVITKTVIEYLKGEEEKQKKVKKDRRLHNIKLLLKNYSGLVLHCEKVKAELIEIDSTSIQDLDISTISLEAIESIKKSREKSLAMVMFVRSKVEAYRKTCTGEGMKYFRVLEKYYLTEKKYSILDIAEEEKVDRATVYRYLDKAISDLSVIFFGIEAIDFK